MTCTHKQYCRLAGSAGYEHRKGSADRRLRTEAVGSEKSPTPGTAPTPRGSAARVGKVGPA